MGFSNLISEIVRADVSNYTEGRNGYGVCKITPHHVAGKLTGKQIAQIFQNPNRNGSANYCIGYDGDIVGCVDENDRAWTSGNRENDYQAITIECSNIKTGGDWKISDATWNSLVNLCVDICKRYNFKLVYDGTKNGSLTRHNMFQATTCPGPYLQSKFPELVEIVNSKLGNEYTYTQFVKDIQKAEGQIGKWIDGIAGKKTLELTPTISRYKNNRNACVKPVQKYLYALGYTEVGEDDGIAGPKFEKAVKHYQKDNGCYSDGEITARNKTWKKILRIN